MYAMAPERPAVLVLVVILMVGCANAPNASQAPNASAGASATASGDPFPADVLNGLTQPETPTYDDATLTFGAEAELEQIAAARAAAGFEALLGSNGKAALEALDLAETSLGEAILPKAAAELGIDVTSSGSAAVAALGGAPGADRLPPPTTEWTGSLISHATFTVSMLTGLLTTAIERAAERDQNASDGTEKFTETKDGVTETATANTKMMITRGDGMVTGDVEITTTADATNVADGSKIGRLAGRGLGHFDINSCPDAAGHVTGRLSLARQEEMTPEGSTGGGYAKQFDGQFTIVVGDDASLAHIDVQMNMLGSQHGGGATGDAGSNYFATVGMKATIDRGGGVSIDRSTITGNGEATDEQVQATMNGYMSAYPIIVELAKQAEQFWRSGKCVELTSSEDSQDVPPEEDIEFDVDAKGKYDKAKIDAPIMVTFDGKDKLEPTTPQNPTAHYTFTAGEKEKDVGTVNLKQTSRRGIGYKTIVFTVKNKNLLLDVSGTLNDASLGASLTFSAAQVTLKNQDGEYKGTANFRVTGSVYIPGVGCSKSVSLSGPAEVTATPDEADPDQVRLQITPGGWATAPIEQVTCEDTTVPVPVATLLWFINFSIAGPPLVKVDGTTTVSAGSPAAGSATVTLTRPKTQ